MKEKAFDGLSIVYCRTEDIETNPEQPRVRFDPQRISELEQSIQKDGLIQPLLVKAHSEIAGKYVLIAGERRLRALRNLGFDKVPVVVRELANDSDNLALAIVENIQRQDLDILEEAKAYQKLIKIYGLSHEECAKRVGKDRSTITNTIRILGLPDEVLEDLKTQKMTMGHARALLSLASVDAIMKVRNLIINKGLSVRKAELVCKTMASEKKAGLERVGASSIDPDVEYIASSLRDHFRTKVLINGNAQKGKIEISYFSPAELERLLGLINFSG